MAVLDNDIWLTGPNGTAENGTTILTEGGHSTTVTGSFSAGAWDASQSGYAVSDFGAFGVDEPITATFGFSNPVTDLRFDLQHVNSSGTSYDDRFTLRILDASGTLVPAADVIAGLTGITHQSVTVNSDGTVTIEGEGTAAGDIGVSIAGPVSSVTVTYEDGEDAPLSGGGGISDLSFTIPPALDYVVEGTSGDDLIDAGYLGDPEGDRVDNADAADGSQDDVIVAGDGHDTILAGDGNDSIEAGDGDDSVLGGDGDDTLRGGWGDDTLYGGEGDDQLEGLYGNDLIYAGAGNDHVFGRDDDDLIFGEEGNDTLIGSLGTDTVWGGEGNDTLAGSQGNDEIHGGAGDDLAFIGVHEDSDTIYLDEGNDFLDGGSAGSSFFGDGGSGNDKMNAGVGDDTLYGGTGKDTMDGGAGADTLDGGEGDDSITGGSGDDTLVGGAGADTLSGGDDRDLFLGGGGDVVDGGEGGDDFDILDLSDASPAVVHYDPDDAEAGTIEFLDDDGNVIQTLDFVNIEKVVGATVPCFTPGTTILTPAGEIPVEHLTVGDEVVTLDHGAQPLRWISTREVTAAELALRPHFNPIFIASGALAPGVPARDLTVSPQHRMLIEGAQAEMLFGTSEVLAAALNLANDRTILRQRPQGVTYVHLLFDTHEIICANGAWSESFQPGAATMAGMGAAQRQELLALFPELADHREPFAAARLSLKSYEAALLEI